MEGLLSTGLTPSSFITTLFAEQARLHFVCLLSISVARGEGSLSDQTTGSYVISASKQSSWDQVTPPGSPEVPVTSVPLQVSPQPSPNPRAASRAQESAVMASSRDRTLVGLSVTRSKAPSPAVQEFRNTVRSLKGRNLNNGHLARGQGALVARCSNGIVVVARCSNSRVW